MTRRFKQVLAVLAFLAVAAPAHAAFIIGSISITDGIVTGSLPAPPSSSVVSALSGIQHDGAGLPFGCTGTFTTEASCAGGVTGAMTDWNFGGPFGIDIITIDGFTFHLTGVTSEVPTALKCPAGSRTCNDALSVFITGTVSGNGYSTSAFSGTLSLSGSCVGNNKGPGKSAQCTSDLSAGYTYSLSATGNGTTVPEPGTLLLIGAGLLGLALMRRHGKA
jgi:hypothetical protein